MKNPTPALALVFLLAVTVKPAAAPTQTPPGPGSPRAPRVVSPSFETVPVGERGLAGAVEAIAGKGGAAWIGYAAPVIEGRNRMCCFDSVESIDQDPSCCSRCRLEEAQSSGSISIGAGDRRVHLEPSGDFVVLLRVAGDRVGKIRAFSDDCVLDAGKVSFFWLDRVSANDSLQYLARFVTGREAEEDGDGNLTGQALNAIAMHADASADHLLERFASRGQPTSVREQAVFWIGVTRGRAGYEILKRLVTDDPDDEVRKKAIFALSQNPTPESVDTMIAVARGDREPEMRGEAIFWLAQKAGGRAARAITQAIENDPETDVKKKAVFALSQLPPDEGVPLLIDLARRHRNPEVRKEAIFWLGQSGDPRALDFIEQVLKS